MIDLNELNKQEVEKVRQELCIKILLSNVHYKHKILMYNKIMKAVDEIKQVRL